VADEVAGPAPVGVVLCGGASTRMGADKALLGPPGRPLAAQVAGVVLGAGAAEVLLVGGDGPSLTAAAPAGATWIADGLPGQGPAVGVATAAAARPGRALLVCACDLPLLEAEDLRPLLEAAASGADAAVPEVDGRPQWSVLALSAAGADSLARAVSRGERALHRAVPATVRHVRPGHPERLRDADRPEDLPPTLRP
jgi:molybdopterin-guanine dinucleotide biosynthesis protein A